MFDSGQRRLFLGKRGGKRGFGVHGNSWDRNIGRDGCVKGMKGVRRTVELGW